MGLFDNFPYTNFHELNLDWILQMLQKIDKTMDEFVAINALKYADPIQWDITSQYEKNTIVIDPQTGTAYISVQPVPIGVILTNTDYWTVVFDLGSFVTKAAQNFTQRWEEETTLTATFPTNAGDWLVWGNTLYIALVNITAGDQYVIDSNIRHFTIEEYGGHLADLQTTAKDNLVTAINEVLQTLNDKVGDLDNLSTTDKSNLVAAINEVLQTLNDKVGDLDNLSTTDKSNLVAAINEVDNDLNTLDQYVTPKVKSWYESFANMVTLGADNTGTDPVDDIFDAALADYDCIYFPAGTYHWTRQHDITSKKVIGDNAVFTTDSFGLNAGSYNAYGGFNSTYPQMLWNVNGADSIIEGFRFTTDSGGVVIRANRCTVRDCYFDTRATISGSTGYYAITIRDCEGTVIDNCVCNMLDGNNRDGIHIESNSYNIQISNCLIYAGDDGIALNALEGAGGSIVGVDIVNCFVGGYGLRFFGNNNCPVRNVNVANCTLRVTSSNMVSGAVRFGNTLNTIGGTPIGGDFIVSDIRFVNCQCTGDKAADVAFYSINSRGTIKFISCNFANNFYLDSSTTGSTLNIALEDCTISGTQLNDAAATGNYYINMVNCEVSKINKLGDSNFTIKCIDCDIASGIDISGNGSNQARFYDCLIAAASITLTIGTFALIDCTVPAAFTVTNGAGEYYVENLQGKDDSSVFTAPASASRICGEVIVSALPNASGMHNGDTLLYNNGYATEKYYVKGGAWKKYFIGDPQTMTPLSAAPTMTDFNNLLNKLIAAGIFY